MNFRPVSTSIHPSAPFLIDNLTQYLFMECLKNFVNEWYGNVNGQSPFILNRIIAHYCIEKKVPGLLFLFVK